MIVAEESNPGHHTTHAKGVAAILQIENSPLEIVQAVLSGHPLIDSGKQVRPLYSTLMPTILNLTLMLYKGQCFCSWQYQR